MMSPLCVLRLSACWHTSACEGGQCAQLCVVCYVVHGGPSFQSVSDTLVANTCGTVTNLYN